LFPVIFAFLSGMYQVILFTILPGNFQEKSIFAAASAASPRFYQAILMLTAS